MNNSKERESIVKDLRINEGIRAREVRVIGDNREHLGVMPLPQALQIAREQGVDLVEVDPNGNPPVCRLLDYGKYKYEQAKKEREARKHQRASLLHEVRMRPKIDEHDVLFKARTAEKFLKAGDKVKITVMFRGREMTHPELGRQLLDRVYDKLKDDAVIERPPNMEGRLMSMILTPSPQRAAARGQRPESKQTSEATVQNTTVGSS